PLIPLEDEGGLTDPILRENFIERIFAYRRWQDFMQGAATRHALVRFHTAHKYQLLAHSRPHYQALGRLVAEAGRYAPTELARRYGALFMEGLRVRATLRKNTTVLRDMAGHLTGRLSRPERVELLDMIEEYRQGLIPLIAPIVLLRHHVNRLGIDYLQDQVYLNPHPKELMLRNRI